ncbi:MAG: isovaleryl-CoA dehydrogenase [Gammaproteobacteria bacterium]|nr:isovaleryl-CoA dehydrogenase [Gammaproteobacteria bacterium]MCP5423638.1 isovaleryl-CoA dehydrogenase [Gammaproteobacteria bacterium]MCP5459891.1 isovaleryl-CoA dehydrogenase [Gammaproteobacteria bacterium]
MNSEEKPFLAETHEVFNQPPPLADINLYDQDIALREALHREGGGWAEERVRDYGALAGSEEMIALGFQANEFKPVLHTHDRFGHRVDRVDYHPAYHRILGTAIAHELHALPWTHPRPGAHVARAALEYLHAQMEAGTGCPLTMTFACIPVIRQQADVARLWEARITARHYDPGDRPALTKPGLTIGMAMTEKQGGSDVRANATRAYPLANRGAGQAYELVGHKWFCSAPMSDAFLVLARTQTGLSCFLLPRWRPDGQRNAIHIQRLKNKLGNASNASSEVEFRGAYAHLLGEEGQGIATIMDMVALTRFDCMTGSAGLMRQAVSQVAHHIGHRAAFGKPLIEQALMQNVAADLLVESEAALALAFRVGRALDRHALEDSERLFVRLATAVGKYWICKRAPAHINEAQECLGGAGYVEESLLPRLYREAPVNSIWEGSGNVQCLDVLRTLARRPDTFEVLLNELRLAQGADRRLDAHIAGLQDEWPLTGEDGEYRARSIVEKMALALQGSLLVRAGCAAVADAFCAARLGGSGGRVYGTLPKGADCRAIITRGWPAASPP